MQLVLSIVANEDADQVTRALIGGGYRVTRMNTAGGFFRRGNVTLLVGVEESQVDDVLGLINDNCRNAQANPIEKGMPGYGATVFVLEADRFVRCKGLPSTIIERINELWSSGKRRHSFIR